MKQQNLSEITTQNEPIAIIGMACRLPGGSNTPEDFWSFLLKKNCGIKEVPSDRWGVDVFYDADPDALSKSVSKWAGFVDDIRQFDAQFFGISPREAASMDPQQRLLLQATYEAMQDSRITPEEYTKHKTGVFVGISQSDYRTVQELRLTSSEVFAGTGYALCINANRISHRMNLTGPSLAIDTACSSSMVALDHGVQNLHSGACEMSVVAGVNVLGHMSSFVAFSKASMLSTTGQISTFDANANGFVRGEGVGVVILKPYSKAVRDGDRIHSVIHATHVNQDGYTSTMTAPNQASQVEMLECLFEKSGVRKDQIGFVEAHGTGTPVGDPIEAGAIGQVIGQHNHERPVYIGSGKANVGHSESAAGITGLIKATMAVKTGIVPPNINFKSANPYIPFDALNLKVPVKPEVFPASHGRRYAVINSFGFGGTNGGALISSAEDIEQADVPLVSTHGHETEFPLFFPVSGATHEAMIANAKALLKQLGARGSLKDVPIGSLSVTLAKTRGHLSHRAVILAHTQVELVKALRKLCKDDEETLEKAPNIIVGQIQSEKKLCFMFSGQGSQWWGMARGLLTSNAVFANAIDAYDEKFKAASGWSIKEELLRDEDASRIDDTTVTQPALFAIQSGLAALWEHFGIKPDMVLGHSIGEAAASYVAGGISLEGAAVFLNKRGAIRDQLHAKGAMAAIGMNHADVETLLPEHGKIGIAAINGPGSTTISGDYDAIQDFVEEFQMMNPDIFIRHLKVDTAWHSYQLDAGEDWFRREMASIDWLAPSLPFISTVTGKLESRFDTDYGWLNLRRPVMFQKGIETALGLGATSFLELGPHSTLAGPTTSTALEMGARAHVLNSISRNEPDLEVFARTAAQLFVSGHDLDWEVITKDLGHIIDLPKYVWANEEFWTDSEESRKLMFTPIKHPFLGVISNHSAKSWRSEINLKSYSYLKDHRLQSDTIFPAAGYIDTLIAAGHELFGDKAFEIEDALIHDAMFIGDDQDVLLSVSYSPERGKLKLYSRVRDSREEWVLRSEAFLRVTDVPAPRDIHFDPTLKSIQEIDHSKAYDVDGKDSFINYGDAFQVIDKLWMSRTKTTAHIILKEGAKSTFSKHFAHPTMLDGCLQITDPRMTLKRIHKARQAGDPTHLPVGARRIRYYAPFPEEILVHARQGNDVDARDVEGGFVVTDIAGKVLMTVDGLMMRSLPTNDKQAEEDGVIAHLAHQTYTELRDPLDNISVQSGAHNWLLLADNAKAVQPLMQEIKKQGSHVTLVERSEFGDDLVGGLMDKFGQEFEAGKITGLVFACPLSIPVTTEGLCSKDVLEPIERNVKDLVAIGDLMDFYRTNTNGLARITILTSGAYLDMSPNGATAGILGQAPIAAVTRVLATETPEYTVRHIDTDVNNRLEPETLAKFILGKSPETEVILSGDKVFAPRLQHADVEDFEPQLLHVTSDDQNTNFHATMRNPGVIDDVALREIPLEPLGKDEVRVKIAAVGLNFRDVMAVTNLLPAEAEPDPAWQHLGLEFGAVVEAVGSDVQGFKLGDRVMGLGRRCLQRFMTVDPRSLTILPEHISLEEAATIPSAFATAHFALNRVGRMAKGEKVFIHVATGGVGTAAVQLAQAAGAEIFATAGSPAKRRILKDLGIKHVMNSRSLKFADDVERITKGKGVDILLNSLPGDYITKGLEIVAPYGRFIEIGKRDVYADSSIGMKALRKNVSVSVLDLAAMGQERPELLADMFAELVDKFNTRELTPLPVTKFPLSKISDAFRYMSQAKHIGKVVVTFDEPVFDVRRDPNKPVSLRENASYLVTGGTKGFGLTIADWMSRAGAGKLVLASRSGTIEDQDIPKIEAMKARGTKVSVQKLDITSEDDVNDFVLKEVNSKKHPLKGVLHGAAVIKDGFANQLTPEMISDVLRPKILGAWNLHRAFDLAKSEPDVFIGFSSIAQVIGSGGQCNYVAANAFLDALAHYRRSMGRSGNAIDWGAIADSGFISRNEGLANYLESVGLYGLSDAETDTAMEVALSRDVANFVYSKADWPQISRANVSLGGSPRFAAMLQADGKGNHEVKERLMSLSGDALLEETSEFIKDEICNVLKIEKSVIQTDRPMSELGLDSLSSFELKMRIETALEFTLPVSKFLQAPSVDELSGILADEIIAMQVLIKVEELRAKEGGNEISGAEKAVRSGAIASNRQIGLLRDAIAPMTSQSGRLALEHHVSVEIAFVPTHAEVEKAMRKLAKRHTVLRLRFGTDLQDGIVHYDADYPMVAEGHVDQAQLDIASGKLISVAIQPFGSKARLNLTAHMSICDRQSAEIILAELVMLLKGEPLSKAVPKKKLHQEISHAHYDPDCPDGQNDRAFWWYSMIAGAEPLPFTERGRPLLPARMGRDHGRAIELTGKLPETVSELDAMVAFAQSIRQATQTEGALLISRKMSLRGKLGKGVAVGPLEIEQPFLVDPDKKNMAAHRILERTLNHAGDHICFDTSAAAEILEPIFDEWGVSPNQIGFSYEEKDQPHVQVNFATYDICLNVFNSGQEAYYQLCYDEDVIPVKTAKQIERNLLGLLTRTKVS